MINPLPFGKVTGFYLMPTQIITQIFNQYHKDAEQLIIDISNNRESEEHN